MIELIVPTIGRPSLQALLTSLAGQHGSLPGRLVLVDDRAHADTPLPLTGAPPKTQVVAGRAAGPASARNVGWRAAAAAGAHWVVFLDDDVLVAPDWAQDLAHDLSDAVQDPRVVAVQGRVRVPLPDDRRPTDWERNVAQLERARWVTADMALRVDALAAVGGFDETFRRAYREDADLALRLLDAGGRLAVGRRRILHPVRPAPWWVSITLQRGNADDAVMWRRHRRGWRQRAGEVRGAFRQHVVTTGALLAAAGSGVARRPALATGLLAAWAGSTAHFAARRIAPGPRNPAELAAMVVTSVAIPPAAVWYRLVGEARALARSSGLRRRAQPVGAVPLLGAAPPDPIAGRRAGARSSGLRRRAQPVGAVLFDRDGTLIDDVPYNGDPDRVVPVAGARRALEQLRGAGIRLGMVSNQSGVARGLIRQQDVDTVNERVGELLGRFDAVEVCTHGPDDGCDCRKPKPGLVRRAAARLGVHPSDCVVVGDIGSDVDAAVAAGARAILVPTAMTRRVEIEAARAMSPDRVAVEDDLAATCRRILGGWA